MNYSRMIANKIASERRYNEALAQYYNGLVAKYAAEYAMKEAAGESWGDRVRGWGNSIRNYMNKPGILTRGYNAARDAVNSGIDAAARGLNYATDGGLINDAARTADAAQAGFNQGISNMRQAGQAVGDIASNLGNAAVGNMRAGMQTVGNNVRRTGQLAGQSAMELGRAALGNARANIGNAMVAGQRLYNRASGAANAVRGGVSNIGNALSNMWNNARGAWNSSGANRM